MIVMEDEWALVEYEPMWIVLRERVAECIRKDTDDRAYREGG